MDKKILKYYEEVSATFQTPGWKLLMEDFEKLLATMERTEWQGVSADALLRSSGMIQQQRYINSLPDGLAAAYAGLLKEEEDAKEDEMGIEVTH